MRAGEGVRWGFMFPAQSRQPSHRLTQAKEASAMKTLTLAISLAAGLLGLTSQAQALGFDCAEAKTKTELTICADKTLSLVDGQVAKAYEMNRLYELQTKGTKRTTQVQHEWLKQRDRCGTKGVHPQGLPDQGAE